MMWGMIPPWHKGNYKNHNLSTNNCRIENITNSKLYTPILNNGGRCVIVVEGYYEWQTTNKASKVKQPYYLYAQQKPEVKIDEPNTWDNTYDEENGWRGIKLLYMAGLYNIWQNEDVIIYSYSVITMESNSSLSWLHHRVPAILDTQELMEAWLDVDNVPPNAAISLLKPTNTLSWHRVSKLVNNSKYKASDCNKKIPEQKTNKEKQKTLTTWFTKTAKRQNENCSTVPSKKNKF
ncbi:unnamed protein product [Chilo suppressalis]|nr:unnamed protein product [Chilo suppressalis]